jgi:hypothetical protein
VARTAPREPRFPTSAQPQTVPIGRAGLLVVLHRSGGLLMPRPLGVRVGRPHKPEEKRQQFSQATCPTVRDRLVPVNHRKTSFPQVMAAARNSVGVQASSVDPSKEEAHCGRLARTHDLLHGKCSQTRPRRSRAHFGVPESVPGYRSSASPARYRSRLDRRLALL